MSLGKRTIALVLVVLVVAGVSLRSRRPAAMPQPAPVAPPPSAVVAPPAPAPSPPPLAPAPNTPAPPAPAQVDPHEQMRAMMTRGFHASRLRIAAFRAHLELSDAEHEKMLDEIIDFKHAIAVVDAPFARVVSFDGDTLVIQIPAHPVEGATVREAFAQQIRKDFPAERAEQIVAGMEPLSALFDYFGQFTMTYTVERPRPDDQVHVLTRATSVDPNDAAAVKKAESLTGAGWMSRDLLEMDNEILIKTVDAHFPKAPGPGN